ncbi:hypothetical protein NC651_037429 [Populus alba x Populus x berolinensis]|nr:hypothetical protein NC651_037429 [Populus alba x Populus x berolinensis]
MLLPLARMNSSAFSFLSDFVLVLLLFIHVPSSSSNDDLLSTACSKKFVCGNISMDFPFWGTDRSPACGVPDFKLWCENNDIATMTIDQVAYRVLEINQDNGILRIARDEDYFVGLCSPQFRNSTFNPKVFEYVEGYKNLTFIYGCKDPTIPGIPFDCNPEECNRSVFVPVSVSDWRPFGNLQAWEELLKKGFEVRWKVDGEACWECSTSSARAPETIKVSSDLVYKGLPKVLCIRLPDYCGYPGFELGCSNQDPEITIMRSTYKLLGVNNQSRTLNVSRSDYTENLCPTLLSNTSLNPNLLSSTSDHAEVTLYYGCPSPSPPALSSQFTCNINDTVMVGNFITVNFSVLSITDTSLISYLTTCNNSVKFPAHQSAIVPILVSPNVSQFLEVINQGFELEWSANDSLCDTCESSGGQCGYNKTTTAFTCYCADQPRDFECSSSPQAPSQSTRKKSRKSALEIGLSLAGALIGAFVGCWIMAFIQRRRRKAALEKTEELPIATPSSKGLATSTNLSQTTPSLTSLRSDIDKGSTYFGVRVFSYDELEEATNFFDSSRELGDGGFGIVYYGVLKDGHEVAVKRLYENNMKRTEQFMNEIEILAHLQHRNLVKLHGCTSRHSRELLLVYEYIPNGTVADHLHGRQSNSRLLTLPVRLSIAIETASALVHLHASDVIHRDVKTNNILLDNDFCVKVADFGLSRLFPTNVTHLTTAPQGTPGYVDPEYYQCYQLTDKSDVYSFGVVLIELISALQAVDTNRRRHDINLSNMAVNKIQNHALNELVDPFLGFDKDFVVRRMVTSVAELAFRCLQQQREMRPTMEEVLEILKRIENENYGAEKADVLDINEDDVGILKHASSPLQLSADSMSDQFLGSSSSTNTPHSY